MLVYLFEAGVYLMSFIQLLVQMLVLVPFTAYTMYGVWPGSSGLLWWFTLVGVFVAIFVMNLGVGYGFIALAEQFSGTNPGLAGLIFTVALAIPQHFSHSIITFIFPRLLWQHEGGVVWSAKSPFFALSQFIAACAAMNETTRLVSLLVCAAVIENPWGDIMVALCIGFIFEVLGRTHWARVLVAGLFRPRLNDARGPQRVLSFLAPTVFLQLQLDVLHSVKYLRYMPVILTLFIRGVAWDNWLADVPFCWKADVVIVLFVALIFHIIEDVCVRKIIDDDSKWRAPVEWVFSSVWVSGAEVVQQHRDCVFHPLKKNLENISCIYISPGSGCVGKNHSVGYVELVFGCLR